MERAYAGDEPPGLLTGDELLRMPWLNPCELVGGRVIRMTPTNPTHGRIEVNVAAALRRFARSQKLGIVMAGEVGVFTSRNPDTVRAPDVLFLSHERDAARTRRDGFLDVAPELVVEILSPTDRRDEVQRKLREYFAAGVRVAWVVDPAERVVRVHAAHGEPRRFAAGDVLSGFFSLLRRAPRSTLFLYH
ncbi:MAG: Uma2 family endonuclease, partial [Acidobacteria bacterium]|nr:Uma2 family endonuclease [Acidobacteriota bacterium]